MARVTKLEWTPPTSNADGTPLSAADAAAMTYTAQIDVINPPVKSYPIPAAAVKPLSPPASSGATVSAAFSDIGFTPADGVPYFVTITATDTEGTSAPTAVVSFTNIAVPSAPLDFGLA